MAHKYESLLTDWASKIEALKGDIETEATGETAYIGRRIANALHRERAFLMALMGQSAGAAHASAHDINQPVKTVMGQDVNPRKPVAPADVKPTDIERDNYLRDVAETLANFPNLTDEDIAKKCKLPGGESVIRGVAKQLELPHYKSGEINTNFIKAIRGKIAHLAAQADKLKKADEKINQSSKKQ